MLYFLTYIFLILKTPPFRCWSFPRISYNEAKRKAKPDEHFGEGELKGIAAPESGNNGATASCLIPLLTLGIPGDAVAATLMGAFTMHGLVVGPKLFETSGPLVYAIMIGALLSQIVMFLQGRYLMPVFVKITISRRNSWPRF